MADLSSVVAPPLPSAAVHQERWLELALSSHPAVAEAGAAGLARLALLLGDFSIADPLLDIPTANARSFAFLVASVLAPQNALDRLSARLLADAPREFEGELAVLDRLGDETTRRSFPAPAVQPIAADAAARAVSVELLDRSGGEMNGLLLLHLAAGNELAPVEAIDAIRRRDGRAVADRVRPLLAVDLEAIPWRDRARAAAAAATAASCLQAIASGEARKERFDRLAIAAFTAGVRARAMQARDPPSALALAFLEGRLVEDVCRPPAEDPTPLLSALAQANRLGADDAVILASLGWRIETAAPLVVEVATRRSFFWTFARGLAAARLDAALVAALHASEPTEGTLGVLSQLASTAAEELAVAVIPSPDLSLASYQPFLLRAFPTGRAILAARRVAATSRDVLQDRLSFLAPLSGGVEVPAPEQPVAHCLACGEVSPIEGWRTILAGTTGLPDPPRPCPACGAVGDLVVFSLEPVAQVYSQPLLGMFESPRQALQRELECPAEPSLLLVDLADLAGDADAAENLLQQVERARYLDTPLLALRILRRRDRVLDVRRLALEARALPPGILTAEEGTAIENALADACAALDEPVPELPAETLAETLPAAPTRAAANAPGRNDPCPCGSGRKFKKCHGA